MVKFVEIWREQCDAAVTILSQYGERAALDYLVGEKLMHFTSAARTRPEFAAQIPSLIARVRRMFHREGMLMPMTHFPTTVMPSRSPAC
jgi:hypothetical protein